MDSLLIGLLLWFGFSLAAGLYAARLGRSSTWWGLFALILSPLLALVFLLAIGRRSLDAGGGDRLPCPHCAEEIKPEARLCPHCRSQLGEFWAARADAEEQEPSS